MTQKKSGKKQTSRKNTKKTVHEISAMDPRLKQEIVLLIALAVCILLFLSNLGLGGDAGKVFSSLFFGIFGIPAYAFPFLLFFAVAFLQANENNRLAVRKIFGLTGVFIFSCAFFQLIIDGYNKKNSIPVFFRNSAYDHSGGGAVGGMIVKGLGTVFGTAGAMVIIVIALIIFTIIMTQKPLLSAIRETSSQAYMDAREKRAVRLARREELRAEREKEREEKQRQYAEKEKKERERGLQKQKDQVLLLPKDEDQDRKEQAEMISPMHEDPGAAGSGAEEFKPEDIPDNIIVNTPAGMQESIIPITQSDNGVQQAQEGPMIVPDTALSEKNPGTEVPVTSDIPEISIPSEEDPEPYVFPPLDLLKRPGKSKNGNTNAELKDTAAKLQQTLHNFGVDVTISNISCGPTVTRYEMHPQQGVKVSKIISLSDDIKLNLAATDIRIEAPIPGKAAIGIEVPNKTNISVPFRELIETPSFINAKSRLSFAVGKDIGGQPVITDIAKMPHLLIAGATGSGKSVCINTLIMSILYKSTPEEVRFIMIDPKVVELSVYNGIPHLFIPVVTDPKKAAGALNWAVSEMTDRYRRFADLGARDLPSYNSKLEQMPDPEEGSKPRKMPRIVIIVDELADLMMVAQNEVEDAICRLAQLARAAGIHLVIATQRPSVNVITGLIKANMPSRIALAVTSGVDSRTILDMNGAEKLLGKGDMLFYPQGYPKPARVQGAFVSDEEIVQVVRFLKKSNQRTEYNKVIETKISETITADTSVSGEGASEQDPYFTDAGKLIIEKDKASIGMLQRAFRIGFNRAARIMDQLCDAGVVGEEEGTKPRKVLMSMEQFDNYLEES